MMQPTIFDLPDAENPEPGQPACLTHGFDYMLQAGGTLDDNDDYLGCSWNIAGKGDANNEGTGYALAYRQQE